MNKIKVVKDDFQAFLVENAEFVSSEDYPIIEEWMIAKDFPNKIIPFNKIYKVKNIEDYYICFYCRDVDFNKIKKNPRRYVSLLQKSKGIIGFDYSIYTDMPKIVQKKQMFDNLALTYFFGKQGIKVIPNLRYGSEEISKNFLEAIPKNELVAIGTYGFIKTISEQNVWFEHLLKIIEEVKPKGIVIYGSLPQDLQNWLRLYNIEFKIYESSLSKEMKEVKANVNKRQE